MAEARFPAARGRRGAVASPHPLATEAGLAVLRRGGTAVDAAVAAGATLAVVYPHMTGLGGDSFWLVWDARGGRLRGVQACGPAAGLATPALYRDRGLAEIPARGPLAALTVPGAVDGLWTAHTFSRGELGSPLTWPDLLADAIRHAADGIPVSPCQARVTAGAADLLAVAGEPAFRPFRETYLPNGRPPAAGARLVQPRLARTLERLARDGGRAFYEGAVGAELACACEAAGSPLRAADLAAYHARWVEPLTVPYRGGIAASLPPPSQGFTALAILGMLDAVDVRGYEPDSADYIHVVVEATKLAFEDRDRWLADPDVARVPTARLLDPRYLRDRARGIRARTAARAPGATGVGGDTVACVAADAAGHCVSLIQSLYHEWGSGLVAGGTGVVLQNRGVAFSLDLGHPNVLAPGRRPFHTLTPFMVLRGGRPVLVAGTMGGEGQPQTLVALATRVLDFGLDVQAAVEAPRWLFGRTWGAPTRGLALEGRFSEAVLTELAARGHRVRVVEPWSDTMGHAQAIWLDPETGDLVGAGDPRADGPAMAF
ncbi:MAG: gamma-glutamyltransferase [Candidatus Rokubacteria bacterium]|nr:gamma-glutamyltransferase [Candidatus Rokubacteria bacterium]